MGQEINGEKKEPKIEKNTSGASLRWQFTALYFYLILNDDKSEIESEREREK